MIISMYLPVNTLQFYQKVLSSTDNKIRCISWLESCSANDWQKFGERKKKKSKKYQVIPPGIEPGTLSVLDSRDNHYTTESLYRDSA